MEKTEIIRCEKKSSDTSFRCYRKGVRGDRRYEDGRNPGNVYEARDRIYENGGTEKKELSKEFIIYSRIMEVP